MQQSESLVNALGHGLADKRIDILRQIGQGGSISQAARAVGVSYKAAWQALDTLTNLAGVTLVERVVGGVGGGGAKRQLGLVARVLLELRGNLLHGCREVGRHGDGNLAGMCRGQQNGGQSQGAQRVHESPRYSKYE